jgi:hypothetical protein
MQTNYNLGCSFNYIKKHTKPDITRKASSSPVEGLKTQELL